MTEDTNRVDTGDETGYRALLTYLSEKALSALRGQEKKIVGMMVVAPASLVLLLVATGVLQGGRELQALGVADHRDPGHRHTRAGRVVCLLPPRARRCFSRAGNGPERSIQGKSKLDFEIQALGQPRSRARATQRSHLQSEQVPPAGRESGRLSARKID